MITPPGHSQSPCTEGPHAAAGAGAEGPLRIAVSLPGGLGPGTYEAGAVCGLLAWVQEVNAARPGSAMIDVISGASAGALTALLAARVLLAGDDPVAVYRQAWVTAPSLRALRGLGRGAPLSLRAARGVANELVFAAPDPEARWKQADPVTLDIALTCLRGFSTPISTDQVAIDTLDPALASTNLDWSKYTLSSVPQLSDSGHRDHGNWRDAIESAIASASHPLFFPASILDREPHRQSYAANGYINLPETDGPLKLWYTDGGMVDNEPLGRCVGSAARADGADNPMRLVMLVRSSIRMPPPATSPAWTAAQRPSWAQTLIRVLDLVATHSSGRDLSLIDQTNSRLRAIQVLATELAGLLADDETTRGKLQSLRRTVVETLGQGPDVPAREADDPPDLASLVETIVRSACGLTDRHIVDVAVVTPEDAYPGPTELRSLFGFIHRRDRQAHFAAGYWNMLRWIEGADTLTARLEPALIRAGLRASYGKLRKPDVARLGRTRRVSPRTDAELTRLGLRTLSIGLGDVRSILHERESKSDGSGAGGRGRR